MLYQHQDTYLSCHRRKHLYQGSSILQLAEKLDADIAELEQKLKAAETVKDDSLSQALGVMKKYSGADEKLQKVLRNFCNQLFEAPSTLCKQ